MIILAYYFTLYLVPVDSCTDVEYGSVHRTIYHSSIEVGTPWIVGADDGILLLEARQVLSACIDAPVPEEAGNLSTHLFISIEVLGNFSMAMIVGQAPTTIQLQSGIKLPFAQSWGEGCRK